MLGRRYHTDVTHNRGGEVNSQDPISEFAVSTNIINSSMKSTYQNSLSGTGFYEFSTNKNPEKNIRNAKKIWY